MPLMSSGSILSNRCKGFEAEPMEGPAESVSERGPDFRCLMARMSANRVPDSDLETAGGACGRSWTTQGMQRLP